MPRYGMMEALDGMVTKVAIADGEMHVRRSQDVEPILRDNARLRNLNDGYSPSRDLRRVAHIPNIIVEQWWKKGINIFDEADWPKITAMLDSPEYAFLRTAPGRVSRGPAGSRQYFGAGGSRRSSAEVLQDLHDGKGIIYREEE